MCKSFCSSMQQINFDLELDPVKLLGGVEVVRSLQDKKKGPKFYVHAKRKPLEAEVSKNDISLLVLYDIFTCPLRYLYLSFTISLLVL